MSKQSFHLLYQPADFRTILKDRLVKLMATDNLDEVRLEMKRHPEAMAMQLDAQDAHEAQAETRYLGFQL